jgi:hypothetical protein
MKNVPHWRLFMVIYFLLVAIPVLLVHFKLKKKLLANNTNKDKLCYCLGVVGAAVAMHFITMFIYFKFIFQKQ